MLLATGQSFSGLGPSVPSISMLSRRCGSVPAWISSPRWVQSPTGRFGCKSRGVALTYVSKLSLSPIAVRRGCRFNTYLSSSFPLRQVVIAHFLVVSPYHNVHSTARQGGVVFTDVCELLCVTALCELQLQGARPTSVYAVSLHQCITSFARRRRSGFKKYLF